MDFKFDKNDQREFAKKSLESFADTRTNNFDPAIDKLLSELKTRKIKSGQRLDTSGKKLPGLVSEDQEISWEEAEIYQEQALALLEYSDNYYELIAVLEMQIIYAFKHLEIGMRTIILANYNVRDKRDISDWEKMSLFLRNFEIDLSKLTGYQEVLCLRQLNNNFKHERELNQQKLSGIKEFANKTEFDTDDIAEFYERIKEYPRRFLQSFAEAIFKERFVFDDAKISQLANELHRRMDKPAAQSLSECLLALY